ncbi:hypothetical protein BDY24DRAFT_401160 [Mrakia frigida]|uniref:uncharacterized protein n=1 Tax=Mrakia frigida TaxID=29902 RepID=UPI003FCC0F99
MKSAERTESETDGSSTSSSLGAAPPRLQALRLSFPRPARTSLPRFLEGHFEVALRAYRDHVRGCSGEAVLRENRRREEGILLFAQDASLSLSNQPFPLPLPKRNHLPQLHLQPVLVFDSSSSQSLLRSPRTIRSPPSRPPQTHLDWDQPIVHSHGLNNPLPTPQPDPLPSSSFASKSRRSWIGLALILSPASSIPSDGTHLEFLDASFLRLCSSPPTFHSPSFLPRSTPLPTSLKPYTHFSTS